MAIVIGLFLASMCVIKKVRFSFVVLGYLDAYNSTRYFRDWKMKDLKRLTTSVEGEVSYKTWLWK
jgi:hypothetical protein